MESTTAERTAGRPRALDAATVCESFQITAAEHPDVVALRTPGGAVEITFAEYADRARSIASGLDSLGVRRDDTVGLMLANRPARTCRRRTSRPG